MVSVWRAEQLKYVTKRDEITEKKTIAFVVDMEHFLNF